MSTATAERPVNNGVNVEALFGAKDTLANAPKAAKFKWRASSVPISLRIWRARATRTPLSPRTAEHAASARDRASAADWSRGMHGRSIHSASRQTARSTITLAAGGLHSV